MIKIKIKKLDKEALIPSYVHPGDAGMDLYSKESVTLLPGEKKEVATGVAMEIPKGYVGLVWDKSGVGIKKGIKTLGGVVDSGYRGEIIVGMVNLSKEKYVFEKNHKVAQMLIQKIESPKILEVEELDEKTSRGKGGFGSTGK